VRRYQRLIYSVPVRCGLSDDEAADVFQQTCLRLLERLDTLNDPARLAAWLATTSRHLSLDTLAKRHREQPLVSAPPDAERADEARLPEEDLEVLEEQHRVRRAVAQLRPPCRALVYHLFYDPIEPSYQQIAAALGMPKGSIGPVRARCFAKLKAILERC
jgi:RNA polymerase sigma factor (sigma-70 family)